MQELVELLKQQQEHAVKMEAQLPPDLRQVPLLPLRVSQVVRASACEPFASCLNCSRTIAQAQAQAAAPTAQGQRTEHATTRGRSNVQQAGPRDR